MKILRCFCFASHSGALLVLSPHAFQRGVSFASGAGLIGVVICLVSSYSMS
jgi:hypothetical protein